MVVYQQAGTPDPTVPFLHYGVVFQLAVYAFELLLDSRQHRKFSATERLSPTLEDALDKCGAELKAKTRASFAASQSYSRDKSAFAMLRRAFSEFLELAQLYCGWYPWLWDFVARNVLADGDGGGIKHALFFTAALQLASFAVNVPFSLWHTFGIEQRHNMNNMSLDLWMSDALKELLVGAAIGLPLLALVLALIEVAGVRWYVYVWGAAFAFSLAMMSIFPTYIQPLFNTFVPLVESGDAADGTRARRAVLHSKIAALAARVEYPLRAVFVVDGSTRSSHSNAYCFGFGSNKRVVLYDTLLEQATDDEVCAIVAHELGHWALGHTLQGFIVTQAYLGAMLFAFDTVASGPHAADMFASFGFAARPTLIGLLLFLTTVWAPLDKVISFALTINSRRHEFQADAFSARIGFAAPLQSGLVKIHVENLSNLAPDSWYSAYHFSHPPLVERLGAIQPHVQLRKEHGTGISTAKENEKKEKGE